MSQNFTIENFIGKRWAEAKVVLLENNPAFFQAIETHYSTKGEDPVSLGNPPAPSYPLGERWYQVLETTVDVSQQLERLRRTAIKAGAATSRQEAIYYFDTWIADIYSICEKVKVLVVQSCRLHSIGKTTVDRYRGEIETTVQDNAGRMRHSLVHGKDDPKAGGLGTNAKAITQDKLWEMAVAGGPSLIGEYLVSPGGDNVAPEWISRVPFASTDIIAKLASILYDLDQGICNTKPTDVL